MLKKSCRRIVEKHLYQYSRMKQQIEAFERGKEIAVPVSRPEAVRVRTSGGNADPTADAVIRRNDTPPEIAQMLGWIWAIETARAELERTSPEKARIMEVCYGLNAANGIARAKMGFCRDTLIHELHIGARTFYSWKKEAVEAVQYAAVQRGVLRPYPDA